jgi:hypothetical protein
VQLRTAADERHLRFSDYDAFDGSQSLS